jgi:hypothetical protein
LLEQWRKVNLQHSVLDPANRSHDQKTRRLLDAHLTTNAVFEAVLVAEIRSPQGFP